MCRTQRSPDGIASASTPQHCTPLWLWVCGPGLGYPPKPEYVGYDWIPLYLLTFPWVLFKLELADGLILNAGLFYLLGALVGLLLDLARTERKKVKAAPAVCSR